MEGEESDKKNNLLRMGRNSTILPRKKKVQNVGRKKMKNIQKLEKYVGNVGKYAKKLKVE